MGIHRTVSRPFFSSFCFSSFDETTLKDCMLHAERLTETVSHSNLGYFVVFCFVCLFVFPLWWDNDRTASQTPSPGLEAEGLTPKLIRMKLYCIWTWGFFFLILCLSNACLAYCWLVHCLSLFISLTLVFLLFVLFSTCLFSPFSLPSLLSLSSHPSYYITS
jgi:hypothetical protein